MTLYRASTPAQARAVLPRDGQPVVILPVHNSYDDVVQCYQAFFRHTPADVPLLVVDDCGWDRRVSTVLTELYATDPPAHDVVVLEQTVNKGFVLTMNDAFEAAEPVDVVMLNSDVIVGPEWFERLRAAAYSSSTVATASALTNHGTILSVGDDRAASAGMPAGLSIDEVARRVAQGSPRLRPRIPTAVGHCTYVKRSVFDAVGYFDPVFSPGYGEEVDLSQRAVALGFEHVAADDVFVYHRGGGSFGQSAEVERRRYDHEQLIQRRYPYYPRWVRRLQQDDHSTLAASLLAARRSIHGLRVAVDAMCLGPQRMGTQIGVTESVRALAAHSGVAEVVMYTPPTVQPYVQELADADSKVHIRPIANLDPVPRAKADVVFRPYQVRDDGELQWLRSVAHRVVVNWLDLIAYNDAAYFASDQDWLAYRERARLTMAGVDGVAFISDHVLAATRGEGLLAPDVPGRVISNGVDHVPSLIQEPMAPGGTDHIPPGFVLVLGVAYLHKNRLFALRLFAALRERGWQGSLVLAGAAPPHGSSLALEAEYLLGHRELASHVVSLGAVSDAEKSWLYRNAGLVLYPTLSEGFGLVPFEAAHYGVPCLSSRMGSLDEVLADVGPTLDSFDVGHAADIAHTLLTEPDAAAKLVDRLLDRGRDFTWSVVADRIVALLTEVTARPSTRTAAVVGEEGHVVHAGGSSAPSVRRARSVDSLVNWFLVRPRIRQLLVPNGSRRQAFARKSIDVAKRGF
ncbi:MAG TPA: glycosyltransferase [Jatrophihabitantaceae bacterium]|nr:glycosyltransferase [Jatrophihabitantaceae bacterium]